MLSSDIQAPRAPAQVAGPWILSPKVAGQFSFRLWHVCNLIPGVLVCVLFLYSGLGPSGLVYSFFYLNEMMHSSLA